jgi:hypothetical protein
MSCENKKITPWQSPKTAARALDLTLDFPIPRGNLSKGEGKKSRSFVYLTSSAGIITRHPGPELRERGFFFDFTVCPSPETCSGSSSIW